MTSSLLLNILLAASLQTLLTMVNTIQLVELISMFNLQMPANVGAFFSFVCQIAEFDVLDTSPFYDQYIGESPSGDQPLYSNFEMIGLNSELFLYNIGSMILIISVYPVFVLLSALFKSVCRCRRFSKFQHKLSIFLFWNKPIVTLMEAYCMLCLCCLINMTQISFDSTINKLSSGLTIAFLTIIVLMPFAAALFLHRRFGKLGDGHYLSRFGSLYSELSY